MSEMDRICFITDACEALGQEIGLFLAKQSTRLVLCFGKQTDTEYLRRLDEAGASYLAVVSPMDSYAEIGRVVQQVKEAEGFGRIDCMYYNSVPPVTRQTVAEMPREMLDSFISDYAVKAFSVTKVVADAMAENGKGVIVYRGSVNDDKPNGIAAFNSMYYAVIKNLNREVPLYYGYHGIRSINLELGAVGREDEEYRGGISTFYEGFDVKIPTGHVGGAEEIASLLDYLFSDGCAMLNGADIRADGGLLFQYIEAVMNIRAHERLRREGRE